MALHNGIDTVAVVTRGVFSKTYGAADPGNIANLFVSRGLLEDAPEPTPVTEFFKYGIKKFQALKWGFTNRWKGV